MPKKSEILKFQDQPGSASYRSVIVSGSGGGGVSDHGALTGLGDDDHSQYGLVVFSATEPASARAGTLWVVTV